MRLRELLSVGIITVWSVAVLWDMVSPHYATPAELHATAGALVGVLVGGITREREEKRVTDA